MLIERRAHAGIRDGSITLLFRRWRRPQAVAGHRYRTAAGLVDVTSIEVVAPEDVSDADARQAGYRSAAEVVADLRGAPDLPTYRLRIKHVDAPDPRDVLAATDTLTETDRAQLQRRLDRLDRASRRGPWTGAVLRAIAANPGVRAADLAASFGRETLPFKVDVRKLKNLGLTISLAVGYRLSPRGRAYLHEIDGR